MKVAVPMEAGTGLSPAPFDAFEGRVSVLLCADGGLPLVIVETVTPAVDGMIVNLVADVMIVMSEYTGKHMAA